MSTHHALIIDDNKNNIEVLEGLLVAGDRMYINPGPNTGRCGVG